MTLWQELVRRAGQALDGAQIDKLGRYVDLLLEANLRMNLTRIVDRSAAEIAHVGDALTVLPFLPAGAITVADVGTGGGVPGIPLAIVRPDARVTLIEATKKKTVALLGIVAQLELTNVAVLDRRAEEVGLSDRRESFDVAVARAVGEMVWLAEWCLPLVRKGGRVLAMKGPRLAHELPPALGPIRRLGGAQPIVHPVDLTGHAGHVIVEIPKIGPSDRRYPRHPTFAKGRPMSDTM